MSALQGDPPMAFLIPVLTRHAVDHLFWSGLPADMGTGGCIDVEMTTSSMALAVGGTENGGITGKNYLATASSPTTDTSNSNNPQQ
jgi:hypothetical protein